MLKAIIEGKAGRVSVNGDAADQSWREVFRKREDLLTAVFFSRLRYLSPEGEMKVVALLLGDELAKSLGSIREIYFWPWLKGLEGRKHVEPDVLIQFENSLLLIEIKPPFGGDQKENQWIAQLESLLLQRNLPDAEIDIPDVFHFLALGRNKYDAQQSVKEILSKFEDKGLGSFHRYEWSDICNGIRKFADEELGRDRHIFTDWLLAFELFGLVEKPLPFKEMLNLYHEYPHNWTEVFQAYELPSLREQLPSVDWQELIVFSNNIKMSMQTWK